MTLTRRDFIKTTALAGVTAVAAGTALRPGAAHADFTTLRSKRRLKILILGGTAFLGPAVVNEARVRGHEVTLFNRGRTNADLFPDIERLKGDRDGDLESLKGRRWDVCLDDSGYIPRMVKDSAELLAPNVGRYIFISSISVYKDFSVKGINEKSPVGTLADEAIAAAKTQKDITGENYGPLKALCEQAAEKACPGRTCVIRPGLIVGPMDRSDRFTYWPVRVARGGEVLAPGTPDTVTQVMDVRDLAAFAVRCMEQKTTGVFNATSAPGELTMGELLDACRRVSASDATFTWADAKWLEAKEVQAWSDMPVWVPLDGDSAGHPFVDVSRALKAGLVYRPISETVRGTLDWWQTEPQERRDAPMKAGITAEREAELLAAWHSEHP
jgi:2'-hydroxyisoflavone reductase